MTPFDSFVFKVASRCNLACDYCYMYFRGNDDALRQPRTPSDTTVLKISKKLESYAKRHSLEGIHIALHGGEPLLVGTKKLERMLNILRNECEVPINFSIQTNGTLLNEDWIDLIERYDLLLGISIDGPPEIHNKHRKFHSGSDSTHEVIRAIRLAQTAERKSRIRFGGTISVIDPSITADRFYSYMRDDLGLETFNVLLPDADHDTFEKFTLSPIENYTQFLIDLFDLWWNDRNSRPTIPLFRALIRKLIFGLTASEVLGGFSAPTIIIEPDGSIEAHDVLRINGGTQYSKLNINDHEIDSIFDDPLYLIASSEANKQNIPVKCSSCPVFDTCQAGFLGHRYSEKNGYNNESVYCSSLFSLITHAYFKVASRFHIPLMPDSPLKTINNTDSNLTA